VNSIWKVLHRHAAMGRKLALAIERATIGQVRAEELILEGAQRTPKPEAAKPKNNNPSERSESKIPTAKTITPDAAPNPPKPKTKHRTAGRDEIVEAAATGVNMIMPRASGGRTP
jgi:hypothetical protein